MRLILPLLTASGNERPVLEEQQEFVSQIQIYLNLGKKRTNQLIVVKKMFEKAGFVLRYAMERNVQEDHTEEFEQFK